jgi:hypothetical protein
VDAEAGGLAELMGVRDSSGSRRVTWVSVIDAQVHFHEPSGSGGGKESAGYGIQLGEVFDGHGPWYLDT